MHDRIDLHEVSPSVVAAGDETVDPEIRMSVLRGWQDMAIERVVPGHGPLSGPEVIDRQLEFLEELKAGVVDALQSGKEADEVSVSGLAPVAKGHQWFVDATLRRWHDYYAGFGIV